MKKQLFTLNRFGAGLNAVSSTIDLISWNFDGCESRILGLKRVLHQLTQRQTAANNAQ